MSVRDYILEGLEYHIYTEFIYWDSNRLDYVTTDDLEEALRKNDWVHNPKGIWASTGETFGELTRIPRNFFDEEEA